MNALAEEIGGNKGLFDGFMELVKRCISTLVQNGKMDCKINWKDFEEKLTVSETSKIRLKDISNISVVRCYSIYVG